MSTPIATNGRGPSSIHDRIDADRKAAKKDWSILRRYREYAQGQQRGTLTAAQNRILRGVPGNRFCDNVTKMVLLAAVGRLQVSRFSATAAALQKWLDDFWTLAQVAVMSNQVHWAALRDGDHAVALSWDNDALRVRLARERWWDGKTGIFVVYDEWDRPVYAVKDWQAPEGMRRVVWYPDRIERYIRDGNGWRHFNPPGSDTADAWQAQWVDPRTQEPLGLPVVHFRNAYMPNDAEESDAAASYGISELDGGVLGLQDEINDVQRDITSAARYVGYQMLTATGVTLRRDENDRVMPLRVEPGTVFQSENPDAKYGAIPAGDLSQLVTALETKLKAVSRTTATPLHEITGGDWPSGEALMRADQPLRDKADNMIAVFAPTWGSLAHKATVLANAFGGETLDTEPTITMVFKPTDKSDPLTLSNIAKNAEPFTSEQEALRIMGYSQDQIDKIMKEKDAASKKAQSQSQPSTQSQTSVPGVPEQNQNGGGGAAVGQAEGTVSIPPVGQQNGTTNGNRNGGR